MKGVGPLSDCQMLRRPIEKADLSYCKRSLLTFLDYTFISRSQDDSIEWEKVTLAAMQMGAPQPNRLRSRRQFSREDLPAASSLARICPV